MAAQPVSSVQTHLQGLLASFNFQAQRIQELEAQAAAWKAKCVSARVCVCTNGVHTSVCYARERQFPRMALDVYCRYEAECAKRVRGQSPTLDRPAHVGASAEEPQAAGRDPAEGVTPAPLL